MINFFRWVFGLKPACEHKWELAEQKEITIRGAFDGDDEFRAKVYTRWYVCPKCLKTKTIRMRV